MTHLLHIYKILFVVLALTVSQLSFGATNTLMVNNGDWADPASWSMGCVPGTGQEVDIPDNMTVMVTTNVYNDGATQPVLTIIVAGTLQFTTTGQLNLADGSVMYFIGNGIMPSTGCNCNQLNFGGGNAEWKGGTSVGAGSCLPSPCSPLSAKILSFSGASVNGKVILNWNTGQEENMDRYEVERSTDGLTYKNIGSVSADGNDINNYSFTDHAPKPVGYYRLKELEKNGSFAYSSVITVKNDNTLPFSMGVYPNPAQMGDHINVHFDNADAQKEILFVLEDMMGKKYFSKVVTVENGSGFVIGNTDSLKPGVYTIAASCNNKFYAEKILVK
jgi:hypothetical protein